MRLTVAALVRCSLLPLVKVGKRAAFVLEAILIAISIQEQIKLMGKKGMGGWLIKMLGLIPYVVSGIEQIHGDTLHGAEKKQLAMEALGLATTTALTVAPGEQAAIVAAAKLASIAIDGVKEVYNATRSQAAAPAPVEAAPADRLTGFLPQS